MHLHLIDAFTDRPFAGNPAGVCWVDEPVPDEWMQNVAREMNQAETAFLRPHADGFELRWFTPAFEVDLCGHATLGSAHFLWETGRLAGDATARFHTRSGLLTARRIAAGIMLDFPATPPVEAAAPPPLLAALGLPEAPTLSNNLPQPDWLVVLDSEAAVRSVRPDFARLREVDARGVIVSAPADAQGIDFVSRFFAPLAGVDEDPVTGSAHCTLGPYWGARLGKRELVGFQESARGGRVGVTLTGDRVGLTGQAVTVVRGQIEPPRR
jgi:PhzF family phenazine biosynthesis protein